MRHNSSTDVALNTSLSISKTMDRYKTMNKKELEINFDYHVSNLEIHRNNPETCEVLCVLLDAIAHELYTRINNKLH